MGTEKRERQKANRALRQQEIQKTESRKRTIRIAAIVGGGLIAVFGLVWIATMLADDDDTATAPTLPAATVPADTAATVTAPVDTATVSSEPTSTEPTSSVPVSTEECPPADGVSEQVQEFGAAPPMCLDEGATYQAVVTTNLGEFTIDLDADAAPNTVNNFVFLARNRYFDETPCHRIIPDFVVQCGDPTGTGTGGPGYDFADELPAEGAYELGSVAMANSGPDTNGSQFFIVTGEQGAALPPNYSLFGEVSDGFDTTVAALAATGTAAGTPSETVEIQSVRIVQS